MKMSSLVLPAAACSVLFFFGLSHKATVIAAQYPIGIANYVTIDNGSVSNGDIISLKNGKYYLSDTEYDENIVGVVNMNPAMSINFTDNVNSYPIIANGETFVEVSAKNGPIKIGDYITSSSIPGTGMKRIENGTVVGQSLDDFSPQDKEASGLVKVSINIHHVGDYAVQDNKSMPSKLKDLILELVQPSEVSYRELPPTVKYSLAIGIIILFIIISLLTFGRVAQTGVEALGRNPLARKTIITGIALNILLSGFIILAGVLIASYIVAI